MKNLLFNTASGTAVFNPYNIQRGNRKPPAARPGVREAGSMLPQAVRSGSLCFLGFFLGCADQVADGAACLAGRLAGSLTFTASFKLNGVLQGRLVDCNDMFGHDVTSPKQFFRINHIIEKRVNTSKNYGGIHGR
jgi:hypothetical protein